MVLRAIWGGRSRRVILAYGMAGKGGGNDVSAGFAPRKLNIGLEGTYR